MKVLVKSRININRLRIMTGIGEGFYTKEELKEWIHHGKIKEFKR